MWPRACRVLWEARFYVLLSIHVRTWRLQPEAACLADPSSLKSKEVAYVMLAVGWVDKWSLRRAREASLAALFTRGLPNVRGCVLCRAVP